MNLILGLDLGAASDYTASTLLELVHEIAPGDPRPPENRFDDERLPPGADGAHWRGYTDIRVVDTWHVRNLRRWPLNTAYPQIVEDVCAMMMDPELHGSTQLVVDYAGPGRPVFDMFYEAYQNDRLGPWHPYPCTLSGGFATATSTGHSLHKGDAIAALLAASQRGRFTVPPELELADKFKAELANFSIKQSKAGNVRFEARGRTHDDLLMSAAIALSRPHVHTAPRCLDAQHVGPFERPHDYDQPADYPYGW